MKQPGLFEGIGVAAVASIAGGGLFLILSPIFADGLLLELIVAGSGLAYVLYLLRRSRERVGRLTTLLGWLSATLLIAWFSPSLAFTVLAHVGLIWLVRALYHHASLLTALADLGLCGLSYAAALWAALQTHSLFASLWCFFLVQALFTLLPKRIGSKPEEVQPTPDSERFHHAWQAAELAVRKLSTTR